MRILYIFAGLFGLVVSGTLATVALYPSRFWTPRLWGRNAGLIDDNWIYAPGGSLRVWMENLLTDERWLHPAGGILRRQLSALLKGSGFGELNAFDMLIWGVAIFLILTLLHTITSKISGLFGRGGGH